MTQSFTKDELTKLPARAKSDLADTTNPLILKRWPNLDSEVLRADLRQTITMFESLLAGKVEE